MANKAAPTRRPADLDGRAQAAREAAAGLRDAAREAHELLAGLRDATREAAELLDRIRPMVEDAYAQQVTEGLAQYKTALNAAIKSGEQAVLDRFDAVVAALLGDDMARGETLEDALRRFMDRQRVLEAGVTGKGAIARAEADRL